MERVHGAEAEHQYSLGESSIATAEEGDVRDAIFNKSNQFICFADNVDMVERTIQVIAYWYTKLKREAEKVRLKVNTSKTKYLLIGGTRRDRACIDRTLIINGDEFEALNEFG